MHVQGETPVEPFYTEELLLVVPAPRAAGVVRVVQPASAIVATPAVRRGRRDAGDAGLVIDYEGNVYDTPGLRRYADRVHHAAGRHLWQLDPQRPWGGGYPT